MIRVKRAATREEIDSAVEIQLRVFTSEQGIAKRDCVEGNDSAVHLLAIDDEQAIATARLRLQSDEEAEVARVAVLPKHRGLGVGQRLVTELESIAQRRGVKRLVLHPHAHLERFYADLGYSRTDDPAYRVGRHQIITMHKSLQRAAP